MKQEEWYVYVREHRRANSNGQSRETGNIGYIRRRQKTNTICVGHHYAETNTNNINKTLLTTAGKDEPNII
jgi:hypothetical protein